MYCKITSMKKIIAVLFGFFLIVSVHAQSADIITEILDTEEATFGQVCYIAAVQMGIVGDEGTYKDAIQALYKNGFIPYEEEADSVIPAVDIAYIYSHMWSIKGGLMFRLTKGSPRYAFKQFQYDGIIDTEMEPNTFVTGAKALSLYTSCNKKYGEFDMSKVNMEAE